MYKGRLNTTLRSRGFNWLCSDLVEGATLGKRYVGPISERTNAPFHSPFNDLALGRCLSVLSAK
jgi:hypothetical protein